MVFIILMTETKKKLKQQKNDSINCDTYLIPGILSGSFTIFVCDGFAWFVGAYLPKIYTFDNLNKLI